MNTLIISLIIMLFLNNVQVFSLNVPILPDSLNKELIEGGLNNFRKNNENYPASNMLFVRFNKNLQNAWVSYISRIVNTTGSLNKAYNFLYRMPGNCTNDKKINLPWIKKTMQYQCLFNEPEFKNFSNCNVQAIDTYATVPGKPWGRLPNVFKSRFRQQFFKYNRCNGTSFDAFKSCLPEKIKGVKLQKPGFPWSNLNQFDFPYKIALLESMALFVTPNSISIYTTHQQTNGFLVVSCYHKSFKFPTSLISDKPYLQGPPGSKCPEGTSKRGYDSLLCF